ncbi:MAG: amino acid adenylation domain-containing protein [Chloroflexi bacterium]|nr:MAG: amino acid adenylation domain-containing protein [Chloroflexota bacterium]
MSPSDRAWDVTVPELVAARAATTPEATAVVAGDQRITYRELDRRANRLAHHLRAAGAGPDSVIGLCLNRSIELVVGALGILKAGAAYLPIDPTCPSERLGFMLRDAGAPILITSNSLAPRGGGSGWAVMVLDEAAASLGSGNHTPPAGRPTGANLAYVIYTSGSTGKAKGVQITHDNLMNLVCWHQHAFNVTAADRATQVASPAFDAAVWELWPYLTAGAAVYIPHEDTRVDPWLLRDWLVAQGITITFLPTPMAETLMTIDWPADTGLRIMLTGGDRLHRYPPTTLPFALINNYGPTETTVVATSGPVPSASAWTSLPSIGRPIAGDQVYVLDDHQQPVTCGTVGELYIGGRGVARGYLNRPELTGERFLPDPFSDLPGARMYRTGDLVRARSDGELEFIGRTDDQVKIRGFRIELGEIEATLAEHPQVRQAVAVAREDTPGEKQLVAYVVPTPPLELEALRQFLLERLPDYMVPAAIVSLPALPLTTNGKVDRRALPAPQTDRTGADSEGTARTLIEERLVGVVATLLKVEQVGPEENFFLLGGHSLLAAQLLVRIRETFGVELPLRTLFELPTVSGISAEIERQLLEGLKSMSDEEAERLLA